MTEIQQKSLLAMEALRRTVSAELEKKRRLGQYAVIYEGGKPIELAPSSPETEKSQEPN